MCTSSCIRLQEAHLARITFYTDEDVNGAAIRIARTRGVSIITADEAGMLGAADSDHFEHAIEKGVILVTANIRHFKPLFDGWMAAGRDHPGAVLITSKKYEDSHTIADELTLIHEAAEPEDMKNRIWWV
jgi:hypothetical protein